MAIYVFTSSTCRFASRSCWLDRPVSLQTATPPLPLSQTYQHITISKALHTLSWNSQGMNKLTQMACSYDPYQICQQLPLALLTLRILYNHTPSLWHLILSYSLSRDRWMSLCVCSLCSGWRFWCTCCPCCVSKGCLSPRGQVEEIKGFYACGWRNVWMCSVCG